MDFNGLVIPLHIQILKACLEKSTQPLRRKWLVYRQYNSPIILTYNFRKIFLFKEEIMLLALFQIK